MARFVDIAEDLCPDDQLVLVVYDGYAVVTLDYSVAGGHLGTVVVDDIALDGLIQTAPLLLMAHGY
ncbi:MAG: hypothetical protein JXA95_05310 [Spirochaetales bacterium]|nr:hypothetical protein [Spirochaetales bacterium]